MKVKSFIIPVILACVSLLFCSCEKKQVPVLVNSLNANEKLDGSWKRQVRASMDLYSDSENPDSLTGEVTVLITNVISFYTDLSFSMENTQVYESFLQTSDDIPFSEEELKKNFTSKFVVNGTYVADDAMFQLSNKTVVLADGSEMTADEYNQYNPGVSSSVITSKWNVADKKLIVTALEDENVVVEYVKVDK